MLSTRTILLGATSAVLAGALTMGGSAATQAVAPSGQATPLSAATAVTISPRPDAPHVGFVRGVERGSQVSIRNARTVKAFRLLHRGLLAGGTPAVPVQRAGAQPAGPETIHVNLGTSIDNQTNSTGAQANQSVSTKIHTSDPATVLYTPTMLPAGGSQGSCIEMSTGYYSGGAFVGAWDWCQSITFQASVTINRAFMHTYTSHGHYSTQIEQTDAATNTWTSYLYNYLTDRWQQFYQQDGVGQVSTVPGWDAYEIYSNVKPNGQSYACQDLRGQTIDASAIMVRLGTTWTLADPSNAGHVYDWPLSAFDCKDITYTIVTPYSHWRVTG